MSRIIPEVGTLRCPDSGEMCHKTTCYNLGQCLIKGGNANPPATPNASRKCPASGGTCYLESCQGGACTMVRASHSGSNVRHVPRATTPAAAAPPCHTGMHKFGQIGKATLWLGARSAVGYRPGQGEQAWALRICLIEGDGAIADDKPEGEVLGNRAAREMLPRELFRKYEPKPVMHIDWPDYGIPTMGREWWHKLYKGLAEIDGNVAVFCMGGHGRTGTFAAIIAALGGVQGCPVTYVRSRYCTSAVEAQEQVEYIMEVTGAEVSAGPRYGAYQGALEFDNDPWERWGREELAAAAEHKQPVYALSRKRYKKWAHRRRAAGVAVLSLDELEDQQQVCVNGVVFAYNGETKGFDFVARLEDLTDGPDPDETPRQE